MKFYISGLLPTLIASPGNEQIIISGLVQTHNNNNNNNNNKKSLSMSEQASLQTPFLHVCALQKQARFCLASISFCAFLSEVVHCLAKQVLNNKSCISKRKEKDN